MGDGLNQDCDGILLNNKVYRPVTRYHSKPAAGYSAPPLKQALHAQIIIPLIVKGILNNGGQIIRRITLM
jgi:hypothetical protein